MNAVILFSGGVDSFVGYHYVKALGEFNDVIPMYIDYNGVPCAKELSTAIELLPHTNVVRDIFNFRSLETHDDRDRLYARNLYFVTYASQFTNNIFLCGLKNSTLLDITIDFYVKASEVCSQVKGERVTVNSPFWNLEKEEVIDWYLTEIGDFDTLLKTTACYGETAKYCGQCLSCWYWFCAFHKHFTGAYAHLKDVYRFKNIDIIRKQLTLAVDGELPPLRTQSVKRIAKEYNIQYVK